MYGRFLVIKKQINRTKQPHIKVIYYDIRQIIEDVFMPKIK